MSLTIAVTAGKTLARNERANNAKLNALGLPTLALSGTASTAQIGDDQVTAAKAAFGAWFLCVDSGTASAHALAASGHTISAYATGLLVRYKVNAGPNTGSTTANLASLGAKKIYKLGGIEVHAGDLRASQMVELVYDTALDSAAGGWWLLSPIGNAPTWDRYATTGGTATAYTATFSPTVTELTNGLRVLVKWNATNTGTATFAPDGLADKAIRKLNDAALVAGDILQDQISELVYDSTLDHWLLTSPTTQSQRTTVETRQCVLSCSCDGTTGLPNYMTGIGGTAISFQNCDTTALVIAFAYGYDSSGAVDYVGTVSTNTSSVWTGLNGVSTTYYLYVDRDISTGALTYGKTTTRPTYGHGAASTTSGDNTYVIPLGKMYLGAGGGVANAVQRVFLGEAATGGGSTITSITPYMPRGVFKIGADLDLGANNANTTYTATHQLGLTPRQFKWVLVCGTADLGYAVGDEVDATSLTTWVGLYSVISQGANATTAFLITPYGTYPQAILFHKTAYTVAAVITPGSWKMRCYAWRGW